MSLIVDQLIRWVDSQDLIRAAVLTSSRAIPHAPVDLFSDYDVILVSRSIHPFYADRTWLGVFGPVARLVKVCCAPQLPVAIQGDIRVGEYR